MELLQLVQQRQDCRDKAQLLKTQDDSESTRKWQLKTFCDSTSQSVVEEQG